MSDKEKECFEEEVEEVEEVEELRNADERAARKLQMVMINAMYKQITLDPLGVSSTLLAVAERMLARWNMGLIDIQADEEMTEEEKQMVKDFENLDMKVNSDLYENMQ